jgi:hypothetical protein
MGVAGATGAGSAWGAAQLQAAWAFTTTVAGSSAVAYQAPSSAAWATTPAMAIRRTVLREVVKDGFILAS